MENESESVSDPHSRHGGGGGGRRRRCRCLRHHLFCCIGGLVVQRDWGMKGRVRMAIESLCVCGEVSRGKYRHPQLCGAWEKRSLYRPWPVRVLVLKIGGWRLLLFLLCVEGLDIHNRKSEIGSHQCQDLYYVTLQRR